MTTGRLSGTVVLLHGAGQSSKNLRSLANGLADRFAVYVPDRRGRGMSPSYGDFRGLDSEVDDLCALLDKTGASLVFSLSAGAVIAIETALVRPEITKLALYEPPLSFEDVIHGAWVPRYEHEIAAERPGSALVAVLRDTADRRSITRYLPEFLLAAPLNFILKRTANRPRPPARCRLMSSFPPCTTTRRRSCKRQGRWSASDGDRAQSRSRPGAGALMGCDV
jgi:pimeloyl-ACP methyl ester carboxylesterase